MPRRPGVTPERITEAALAILEREGSEGLTLTKLAKQFNVKPPSLYNHIGGIEDLHRTLRLRGLRELKAEMQSAAVGRSRRDALVDIANAYRDYAVRNPALYRLTLQSTEDADEELRQAGSQVVEVVLAVLRGYDLHGEDAIHAVRILRSTLHGFVSLETTGAFALAVSVDETYQRLLDFLHSGLESGFPPSPSHEDKAAGPNGHQSAREAS